MPQVMPSFLEILIYFTLMLNGREMQSYVTSGKGLLLEIPFKLVRVIQEGLHALILSMRDPVWEEYFKKLYISRFPTAILKEANCPV